jgi:hypothetical protein
MVLSTCFLLCVGLDESDEEEIMDVDVDAEEAEEAAAGEEAADGGKDTADDPNKVARIQGALAIVDAEVVQGPGVLQSMIDVKATYGYAKKERH